MFISTCDFSTSSSWSLLCNKLFLASSLPLTRCRNVFLPLASPGLIYESLKFSSPFGPTSLRSFRTSVSVPPWILALFSSLIWFPWVVILPSDSCVLLSSICIPSSSTFTSSMGDRYLFSSSFICCPNICLPESSLSTLPLKINYLSVPMAFSSVCNDIAVVSPLL